MGTIYSLMYFFPSLEPVCYSMSSSNGCFLSYTQVSQEASQVVWYSHLLKNFPQFVVIHTVKGFSIVNEAELYVFYGTLLLFLWSNGSLISASSIFSKFSLYIWKLLVHILLKPSLKDFEYNLVDMWNECNCIVIWIFLGIALLWDWNEIWIFSSLWLLLSFLNLLA